MERTLPESKIASIPVHDLKGPRAAGGEQFDRRLAELLGEHGIPIAETKQLLEVGRRGGQAATTPEPAERPSARSDRRTAALEAAARVEKRFPGKLQLGHQLASTSDQGLRPPLCEPHPEAGAPCDVGREPLRADTRGLARQQRRVLTRLKTKDLERIALRFDRPGEETRTGVWTRTNYRIIRAAVQDASGKAAECALYLLGTSQAAALAADVNTRIPMDRRRVALAYAIATSPGSELGANLKLGFSMGLWSAVLADPNNPNMERGRQFRPSRRTLCDDLTWLQELGVMKRWQVRAEFAAPCELKTGQYPTNRYYAPQSRTGKSMLDIALALRDLPPEVRPSPSEEWSEDDATAMKLLRAELTLAIDARAPAVAGPPS